MSRTEAVKQRTRRGLGAFGAVVCALCWTLELGAESAEDRATARQLATRGVELYREEKFQEALEQLERAERLYTAPVHLLYIARSQKGLGRLVLAAETYRSLLRTELTDASPEASTRAVEEADQELRELEPRIPGLIVRVTPEQVDGLVVTIDGEALKSAALGVQRPTDPGKHVLEAKAPGFETSRAEVELVEGAREEVQLELEAGGEKDAGAASNPPEGDAKSSTLGLLVGLRLGGFGRIGSGGRLEDDVATSDYFPSGGGGELQLGLRFGRYFAVKLGGHAFSLAQGAALEARALGMPDGVDLSTSQSSRGGSLAFSVSRDPRRFGGFGEAALVFNEYRLQEDLRAAGGESCSASTAYGGGGLRLGGGLYVPVASYLTITPLLQATFGSFSSLRRESAIAGASCAPTPVVTESKGEFGVYHEIFLGVGGDFLFGERWFR